MPCSNCDSPELIVTITPNSNLTRDWAVPSAFSHDNQAIVQVSPSDQHAEPQDVPCQSSNDPRTPLRSAVATFRLPTTTVWGTRFARLTMIETIELADRIIKHRIPQYMITANLNYLMLVDELPQLRQVNQDCCCILADGNPIVWRSRYGKKPLPCRVAGSDMIVELARLSSEQGYRIFFLGGKPGVAEAAAIKLGQRFPQLQVAGTYSPPFRKLTPDEHQQILQRIRSADTDILLVAFGQPKGELWIHENWNQLDVPLSIQLGASFDFLAGTAKRAPKLWQRLGCEWLYRALSDPRRLLPRYGKNLLFLLRLLLADTRTLVTNLLRQLQQPQA